MNGTNRSTSALRTRIEWCVVRLFARWVRAACPAGARRTGVSLGDLAWRLLPERRRIAEENLRSALGRSDPQLVRAAFQNFGRTLVEALRLPDHPPSVRWAQPNALAPILGRRALILGGHLGNWEVAAWAIAHRAGRLHLVVAEPKNPLLAAFLDRIRRAWGVVPHDRKRSPRPIIAALRRGELVATAADQWPAGLSVTIPFFGRPTPFGTGMFRIAAHTGAPVIAIAAVRSARDDDGTPRFTITTEVVREADDPTPPEASLERWVGVLERWIRENPEQYLWLHKRWKTGLGERLRRASA